MQSEKICRKNATLISAFLLLLLIKGCTGKGIESSVTVTTGGSRITTSTESGNTTRIAISGKNSRSVVNNVNNNGRQEKRSLETSDEIKCEGGQIVSFAPGTVIRLSEQKGSQTRSAELRENNGKLILWIKEKDQFHKGDAHDDAWLKEFLAKLNLDDRSPKDRVMPLWQSPNFSEAAFRAALDNLPIQNDRAEILKSCARQSNSTPEQQVAIVNACYDKLDIAFEQKNVLLELINSARLSKEARKAIINRLDQITIDSFKVEIQKALLDKE